MSIEALKTLLVEKIIYSQDERLLENALHIFSAQDQVPLKLNDAQKAMIERGLADVAAGRVISQEQLDREEAEWL